MNKKYPPLWIKVYSICILFQIIYFYSTNFFYTPHSQILDSPKFLTFTNQKRHLKNDINCIILLGNIYLKIRMRISKCSLSSFLKGFLLYTKFSKTKKEKVEGDLSGEEQNSKNLNSPKYKT